MDNFINDNSEIINESTDFNWDTIESINSSTNTEENNGNVNTTNQTNTDDTKVKPNVDEPVNTVDGNTIEYDNDPERFFAEDSVNTENESTNNKTTDNIPDDIKEEYQKANKVSNNSDNESEPNKVEDITKEKDTGKENKETNNDSINNIDTETIYTSLLQKQTDLLVSKGILNEDDLSDIDLETLDDDGYANLIDNAVENKFNSFIDNIKEEGNEELAILIDSIQNGIPFSKAISSYRDTADITNLDPSLETDQERISNIYQVRYENKTPEEAQNYTNYLKDNNKLKEFSEGLQQKVIDNAKLEAEKNLKDRKLSDKQKREKQISLKNGISKVVKSGEVGNIKISSKEKSELNNYITQASVKINDNLYVTPLQSDIASIYENPEQLAVLALMARKIKDSNFNWESFSIKKETQQTRTLKDTVKELVNKSVPNTTHINNNNQRKKLADYF